ncbi:MAG: hypothetical protein ACO1O1_00455 [Adhaeribacter sp.]
MAGPAVVLKIEKDGFALINWRIYPAGHHFFEVSAFKAGQLVLWINFCYPPDFVLLCSGLIPTG